MSWRMTSPPTQRIPPPGADNRRVWSDARLNSPRRHAGPSGTAAPRYVERRMDRNAREVMHHGNLGRVQPAHRC